MAIMRIHDDATQIPLRQNTMRSVLCVRAHQVIQNAAIKSAQQHNDMRSPADNRAL
jgi:hypothetical protein